MALVSPLLLRCGLLAAIEFDYQAPLDTTIIREVRTNALLAAEFETIKRWLGAGATVAAPLCCNQLYALGRGQAELIVRIPNCAPGGRRAE